MQLDTGVDSYAARGVARCCEKWLHTSLTVTKLRLPAGGKGLHVLEAEESTYPCRAAFSAATAEHFGAYCRVKNAQGT